MTEARILELNAQVEKARKEVLKALREIETGADEAAAAVAGIDLRGLAEDLGAVGAALVELRQGEEMFGILQDGLQVTTGMVLELSDAVLHGGGVTREQAQVVLTSLGQIREQLAELPETRQVELALELEGVQAAEAEFERFLREVEARAQAASEGVRDEVKSLDEVFATLFDRTDKGLSGAATTSREVAQALDAGNASAKKLAEEGGPALDKLAERTAALSTYTGKVREDLAVITSLLQEIDGLTA